METRKISELEQLEALNDATNIVVEDAGKTKRFPANQVGKVKFAYISKDNENKLISSMNYAEIAEAVSNGSTVCCAYDGELFHLMHNDELLQMSDVVTGGNATANMAKRFCFMNVDDDIHKRIIIYDNDLVVCLRTQLATQSDLNNIIDTNGKLLNSVLPDGYPYETEPVLTVIVPEQTVTFNIYGSTKVAILNTSNYSERVEGDKFLVSINGGEFEEYTVDAYLRVMLDESTNTYFEIFDSGKCNLYTDPNTDCSITSIAISKMVKTIVPMSEDFLPTEAAHVSTAQVGQTIVVKAVDENGKPTEWEAVDMASGTVKTVNGVTPDTAGNVAIEAGGPLYVRIVENRGQLSCDQTCEEIFYALMGNQGVGQRGVVAYLKDSSGYYYELKLLKLAGSVITFANINIKSSSVTMTTYTCDTTDTWTTETITYSG